MMIVMLSGGSGKRLWPLSCENRPKQFLKILPAPSGQYESMVQRVYRQIREAGITDSITITTGISQVSLIREQLGMEVDIVQEPTRRDTYPAIALSCVYLAYEKYISLDEVIAVLPIDPYCETGYFEIIKQMASYAQMNNEEIILMGINPTEPSEKFGYIVPKYAILGNTIAPVGRFIEKPKADVAEKLIAEGALWNGGVFVFKLRYMTDIINNHIKIHSYEDVLNNYNQLTKTSFDFEVVEKAECVGVVKYTGHWQDLGTWGALSEKIKGPMIGNAMMGEGACNTQIVNELEIPIIALGVNDLVIVASKEGILVTKKENSENLKTYVDKVG